MLWSNSNSRYHMAQFIDTATERLDVQHPKYVASLRTLRRFGVKAHKQKNLRVHAKLIVDDNAHALVGSMNIDRSAFDLRRELGTLSDDSAIAERLKEVFDSEWDLSHHDGAPEPLDPSRHHEDDFPSCMSEIEAGPKKVSLIAWPPREAIDLIHC
jgi:phosphatidylserine/phosphatidylglycerophosphate/cardiolipin synthase-like enzyme